MEYAVNVVGVNERRTGTSTVNVQAVGDVQIACRSQIFVATYDGQGVSASREDNHVVPGVSIGFHDRGAQRAVAVGISRDAVSRIRIDSISETVDDHTKFESADVRDRERSLVSRQRSRHTALIRGRGHSRVACFDGRAVRQQCVGEGQSAVVVQRSKQCVDGTDAGSRLIAVHSVGESRRGPHVADQVVALRDERAGKIGSG